MEKLVGTYDLGLHRIRLFIRNGTGGEFTTTGRNGLGEIRVGVGYSTWPSVLSVLLHEAMEFTYAAMELRLRPDADWAQASDGYVFHFDHSKFSEATARVAYLLAKCVPDLATAFNAHRKLEKSFERIAKKITKKSKKAK